MEPTAIDVDEYLRVLQEWSPHTETKIIPAESELVTYVDKDTGTTVTERLTYHPTRYRPSACPDGSGNTMLWASQSATASRTPPPVFYDSQWKPVIKK